jgi:hypothetical protein
MTTTVLLRRLPRQKSAPAWPIVSKPAILSEQFFMFSAAANC